MDVGYVSFVRVDFNGTVPAVVVQSACAEFSSELCFLWGRCSLERRTLGVLQMLGCTSRGCVQFAKFVSFLELHPSYG